MPEDFDLELNKSGHNSTESGKFKVIVRTYFVCSLSNRFLLIKHDQLNTKDETVIKGCILFGTHICIYTFCIDTKITDSFGCFFFHTFKNDNNLHLHG